MQYPKLVQKLKSNNSTIGEQIELGTILNNSKSGLALVAEHLAQEIWRADAELSNTSKLYGAMGDSHMKVATLLVRREAYMTLRSLLTDEITLDADNAGD